MKQTLRKLIAEGKTTQVIDQLLKITVHDPDLNHQVTLLSAQFKEYDRQKRMGLEDATTLNIQVNRINSGLLAVIEELNAEAAVTPSVFDTPTQQPHQGFSWTKWTGLTDVKSWIAAVAGIAGILTFYVKYCKNVPNNDGKPFSVVVYTHGQGGRQDIIQLKDTKLVADFGGRREVAKVGDNGQNTFNEVPTAFHNQRIGVGLSGTEGYILRFPDSTYTLDGTPIYVAIQSSCRSCKIEGIVRNQKQFIANALVSTSNFSDTTDANGYFEIQIPPSMEKSEYGVTVRLNNKIVWDKFITPNPKQPAEVLINY